MSGTLELLIEALNANTAALLSSKGEAAGDAKTTKSTSTKTTSTKTTATKEDKPAKPTFTKQQATQAIVALKDAVGTDAAKALLSKHGFKKLADITEDKFDVLHAEATAELEEFNAANAGGEEEGDDDI